MPNGEPPCLGSELGCLGSEMGEKVDFHLLLEDREDEEEPSLPVLLPLLLPDFRTSGGEKNRWASSGNVGDYMWRFLCLPLSPSPCRPGPSLLSKDMVAIFLSILETKANNKTK